MAKNKKNSQKNEETKTVETIKTEEIKTPENFTWKNGTTLEKISFVGAVITLIVSVVFLFMEFIYEYEEWPYICFDFSIALTFVLDAITNLRHHRGLAIVSFIFGALFLAYAIYKIVILA